jgi:transcriptional regulator with XRE-family HTH domain
MINTASTESEVELHRWMGARVRHIRVTKNMTQEELAQRMGTQRPAVSNWENGINMPSLFTLKKMSTIFGVSLRQLIEGESSEPTDVPMIPLETAVDKPGLERWIRLYERLSELGEGGQSLLQSTLRIFGRLGALGENSGGQVVYSAVMHAIQQSLDFGLALLTRDDYRRTVTFLREIGLPLDMGNDQDRFVHIHQVFVPPSGYLEVLARSLVDQQILIITGDPHEGKTFVGVKMLADLAEGGFRPFAVMSCFTASASSGGAPAPRLADYIGPGRAVLLDDPFDPAAGALALREFAADPAAAFELACKSDCRLIVTVGKDDLAEHSEMAQPMRGALWSLDGQHIPSSFVRMGINYSEIFHPNAREPIVASLEGLLTPHAVERSFAVATDNRQTVRRRSAGIRRDGIEAITVADFASLDDTQLAVLILCRYVPIPWPEIASMLPQLDVGMNGGGTPSQEALVSDLQRWLVLTDINGCLRYGFYHPSYATALSALLRTNRRAQALATRVFAHLVMRNDPFLDRAALQVLTGASHAGARNFSDALEDAGLLVASTFNDCDPVIAAAARYVSKANENDVAATADAFRAERFSAVYGMWFRRLMSTGEISIENAATLSGDPHAADLWAKLARSFIQGEGKHSQAAAAKTVKQASLSEDIRLRAFSGVLAVENAAAIDNDLAADIAHSLTRDTHLGVVRCVRRAVNDNFDLLPKERRDALALATR